MIFGAATYFLTTKENTIEEEPLISNLLDYTA